MMYTYLFHRPSDGLTKIGRTRSPQQRFKALGGASKLRPIALILGDMERNLHEYHKDARWSCVMEALAPDVTISDLFRQVRDLLYFEEQNEMGGDVNGHEEKYSKLMETVDALDPDGKIQKGKQRYCDCSNPLDMDSEKYFGECQECSQKNHQN